MSDTNDKKMRQMFRRHIREHLEKLTTEYFLNDAPMFNQKPKWMPKKVWNWMIKKVVDFGFLTQYNIRQRKIEENRNAIAQKVFDGKDPFEPEEIEDDGSDDIYFAEGYVDDENDATIEVDEDTDDTTK